LFAPAGVVVVGASRRGDKLGAAMARSLAGFTGGCALVNARNPEPAAGVFPSMAAATAEVPADLAVFCVPAAACAGAVREAAAAGVRAILVCAGGFGEIGPAGDAAQRALHAAVSDTGVRLLGPNTSGFFVPARGLTASFVPGAADVPAGGVAVVAASGGVNHALAFEIAAAGSGLSLGVGIGAGLDVTAADVLAHLATDPDTAAVALHVETVPDGPALVAAVRTLSAAKPVVALVVGRDSVGSDGVGDFARSHTGALATSWRTTRAALRQAGAVVVDDERELVDAVTVLSQVRLRPATDPGVGLVTAQAGPGLLVLDRLRADGIRVPALTDDTGRHLAELLPPMTFQRNPVDTGRPTASFPAVLRAVADDPGIDLLATYTLLESGVVDLVDAAHDAGLPGAVPALMALGGPPDQLAEQRAQLHKLGIPTVSTPAAAVVAIRALVTDARARARATGDGVVGVGLVEPVGALDEDAAKSLLAALGIATPRRFACDTRQEAHAALRALGGPVVVKLLDAAVPHKSEVGGVHVGVRTAGELDRALDRIGAHRYLIEAMAPPGVELIVAARRDPVFGPVVLLGMGGTAAEAFGDVALRLAPLTPAEAATMPDDLAARALLDGWRGAPPVDRAWLGALVSALGAALTATEWLSEIEINPLRATPDALLALDAVAVKTQR
jgi:acetyltransferase